MHVDLTGARSRVPWTTVRDYIHRSRAQLTNATITNLVSSATPKVLDMLSRCPKLEHLEFLVPHDQPKEFYQKIQEFRHLKSIVCGPDIKLSYACVGSILSTLTKLEKATFSHVWDGISQLPRPTPTWPQHLPNMKSLTIGSSQDTHVGVALTDVVPGLGTVNSLQTPFSTIDSNANHTVCIP
jgi:F-box/TPR repeat protein Pof3